MYEKISNTARIYYILIAVLLFLTGLVLLIFFFLIITVPFGLAALAWAGIFVYLAIVGRPYSDFKESLKNYPLPRRFIAKRE
jgi:hypothetical protein